MRLVTGVTVRFGDEAHKGCGLAAALAPGWRGWRRCQLRRDTVTGPRPMEHEAQPYEGDQHQLIEKYVRYLGKIPSYKCGNEGILPGFQTAGISRTVRVHDPTQRFASGSPHTQ